MDLFLYILLSGMYLMLVHLAIAIGKQFNMFLMVGIFIAGGVIGHITNSYELGFVGAIIASFIFW